MEEKSLYLLTLLSAAFIIAVVAFFVYPDITGAYTATRSHVQYTPREVCEVNGCVWDLELQNNLDTNAFHAPVAGGWCGQEGGKNFPLI